MKRSLISVVIALCVFFALCSPVISEGKNQGIEELKRQIEEIQRKNEERIRELQQESQARIRELQKRIEELEKHTRADGRKETSYDVVDEKGVFVEAKSPSLLSGNRIKVDYSPDFSTYFRTRVRYINDATFLGVASSDDEIFFVDSRFVLSPRISYDKFLSIRGQLDIAKNLIWGGLGDEMISDKLFSAPNPGDSFRGAILRDVISTQSGSVVSSTESIDIVDIRSLYFTAVTDYGVLWAGRQPFDWGLGILNNAGSMPDQDLGSIVDRINFDTAPLSLIDKKWEKLLFSFIFDRLSEGRSIGSFDDGDGWDLGLGVMYSDDNLEAGIYVFGIYQNNFSLAEGITADLEDAINWSLYTIYRYDPFRFSFEFQHIFGNVTDIGEPLGSAVGDSIDITGDNISLVARVEYDTPWYFLRDINLEFGWSGGDDATTPDKIEGNTIFFNNAYVIDNLLYKHIIPTAYALEGSVINSYYFRGWGTFRLIENLYLTPQLIVGFVDEKNALSTDPFSPLPPVDSYLGTELEATLTWKLRDHIWFDLIGSVVFAGKGLDDLLSQRALIEGVIGSLDEASPPDIPYAVQGRFIITLDSVINNWYGNSTVLRRAWYDLF